MLHGSHDLFHDYMYIMYEFFLSPEHMSWLKIIVLSAQWNIILIICSKVYSLICQNTGFRLTWYNQR